MMPALNFVVYRMDYPEIGTAPMIAGVIGIGMGIAIAPQVMHTFAAVLGFTGC